MALCQALHRHPLDGQATGLSVEINSRASSRLVTRVEAEVCDLDIHAVVQVDVATGHVAMDYAKDRQLLLE